MSYHLSVEYQIQPIQVDPETRYQVVIILSRGGSKWISPPTRLEAASHECALQEAQEKMKSYINTLLGL